MHFNLMVPSHMRPLTLARICFAWARPSWQVLLPMPALILTSILRPPALLMLAEMVSTKLMMPAFLDLRPDILVGCFVSYSKLEHLEIAWLEQFEIDQVPRVSLSLVEG